VSHASRIESYVLGTTLDPFVLVATGSARLDTLRTGVPEYVRILSKLPKLKTTNNKITTEQQKEHFLLYNRPMVVVSF
jgi:hypothetical protein